eukprot:s1018_g19.t1
MVRMAQAPMNVVFLIQKRKLTHKRKAALYLLLYLLQLDFLLDVEGQGVALGDIQSHFVCVAGMALALVTRLVATGRRRFVWQAALMGWLQWRAWVSQAPCHFA